MPLHRHRPAFDPVAAALAHPSIAGGCVLLAAAVVELPRLPLWTRDYGNVLVYMALALYCAGAVALLRTGWHTHRLLAEKTLGANADRWEQACLR
ncbi:hypothetical protein [Nocardia xishanensis]|uniref:hypothetical protein n=1 Tax=Nocardia xishanensis TaxID=238964 RepID=UPI000ABF1D2D|nr:hypothetical protein [Nocardia xishanensis]